MSLAEYDILQIIGRGTYGEVNLVTHMKDRKQYVIKKMNLVRASAKERKAAEQEAKLLSKLRHPNIVSYKDSFESENGYLYIVMGFAEGGDLYTKLREHREKKDFLSEQQVVRWYIQICMALQYLHERKILHRDLKTQNIFLTKTKMIKVGDLGIAKVLESSNDMATTLIGTPYYMSPELFSNRPYNHKSDVWALGCCIYEMVTLKHAFNAKDMNSLVYKILKGKMPPMPDEYSNPLCDLIKAMLHHNADKRPSVNRILRNPYIKQHIKLFLDESSRRRRPASGRSSRPISGASSRTSSGSASRKTSVNSQGSASPSPHPPTSVPEPSRLRRGLKGHSPIAEVPSESPDPGPRMNGNRQPERQQEEKKEDNSKVYNIQDERNDPPAPSKDDREAYADEINSTSSESTLKSTVKTVVETEKKPQFPSPQKVNLNSNNSHVNDKPHDSGIYMNYAEAPKQHQVVIHQKPKSQNQSKPVSSPSNMVHDNQSRASSASSASSTSSAASRRKRRPLPNHPAPKSSVEPKIRENVAVEKRNDHPSELSNSIESISSVASSVISSVSTADGKPSTSSARQRRRERQRKEKIKTPPILEEIRRSRNSGILKVKPIHAAEKVEKTKTNNKDTEKKISAGSRPGSGDSVFVSSHSRQNSDGLSENSGDQQQPEIEEFMTLLHTTLNLGNNQDKKDPSEPTSSSSSPSSTAEDLQGHGLSPVPEMSESTTQSNNQNEVDGPYSRNTPAATPIGVSAPPQNLPQDVKRHGISHGTLRSTQRLMDRIVFLRRDCIHGLGVPLLHRAYEVLDSNEDEDLLQKELMALLGPVRFDQWAGKIWQLKFCEESMFGHCGTITAF